jgi:hypothetical protein
MMYYFIGFLSFKTLEIFSVSPTENIPVTKECFHPHSIFPGRNTRQASAVYKRKYPERETPVFQERYGARQNQ